jgi:RNA polymerase sigma-70 factor (ECF subfamily)
VEPGAYAAFLTASGLREGSAEAGRAKDALEAAMTRAHSAHPEIAVPDDALAAVLGLHARSAIEAAAGAPDVRAAIDDLQVEDLHVALACGRGDAAALRVLERDYLGPARAGVMRIVGAAEADEQMQAVREKLLVAAAGVPPKIGDYGGRGALAGWIKVVAVRVALTALRGRKPETAWSDDDDALLELPHDLHETIEPMRARYGAAFKAAFHSALASLEARERTLLRLQFIDALSVDQIGALYHVHRATAARWVARARENLNERTQRALARDLGLDAGQLSSILGVVLGHVDVSLLRVLGAPDSDRAAGPSAAGR